MGKKLLVADDSLTIQKVIKLALSGEGYEIQTVSDGNEVLAQMSLFRPDAVLIDVALPGRTAFELKTAVNQDPDLLHIPFVLMSGAYEKVDEARVSSLKFEGRLAKPFDPSTLKQSLNQVMKSVKPIGGPLPPIPPRPPSIDMVVAGNPPPPPPSALFMKKPDSPVTIEFNDDLWEKEDVKPAQAPPTPKMAPPPVPSKTPPPVPMPSLTISTPPMPPAPPMSTQKTPEPPGPLSESETLTDLSMESLTSTPESSPNNPFSLQDFTGPSLDFLRPQGKKPATPTLSGKPSPLETDESDIRDLTESTVKMSGLDDLDGWNINESAKSSVMPSLPGIFENESPITQSSDFNESFGAPSHGPLDVEPSKDDEEFELTGIGITGPRTLAAGIPTSVLDEIVEKQVRSQIEFLVQQKVKELLEQMAKDQIPEIAEKVMKQEIRRLLESLGEMG